MVINVSSDPAEITSTSPLCLAAADAAFAVDALAEELLYAAAIKATLAAPTRVIAMSRRDPWVRRVA